MASVTATCAAGPTTKTPRGGVGGGNVRTCVDCVRGAEQVCASACDTMHYGIHGQPLCCNICVKTRTRSCALQVFFYLAWLFRVTERKRQCAYENLEHWWNSDVFILHHESLRDCMKINRILVQTLPTIAIMHSSVTADGEERCLVFTPPADSI